MDQSDVIIIGSGLAGFNLVKELRKLDNSLRVSVLTSEQGHFYSKPMLSNALSKNKTAAQLPIQEAKAFAEQYQIDLHTELEVVSIQPQEKTLKTDDGREFFWNKLVLAVGASPIDLKALGVEVQAPTFTVNQLSEYGEFREALSKISMNAEHKRARIGIIGSGLVGCEFANDLIDQGFSVDVFDVALGPMSRLLPQELSKALEGALQDRGVNWHWQQQVQTIKSGDLGQCEIITAQGGAFSVDLVLSAIGLKPSEQLAKAAGLAVDRGVRVNAKLESTHPDVYAIGDCACIEGISLQYVLPLMSSARALAKTLTGKPTEVVFPAMPVVVKTPALPTVVAIPPNVVPKASDWHIKGHSPNLKAELHNASGDLVGFALTGECVTEKNSLAKLLPDWLNLP